MSKLNMILSDDPYEDLQLVLKKTTMHNVVFKNNTEI